MPANDTAATVARLSARVADMNDWMKASHLQLNPSTIEVMWLDTSQQLDKVTIGNMPLLSTVVTVVDSACNFGVIMDSQLSLDTHVVALCHSSYYQLRELHRVLSLSLAFVRCPCSLLTLRHLNLFFL